MRRFISMLAALAICYVAEGHRLDEYLQAARLNLDLDRISLGLDLTPGVEVADKLLPILDPSGREKTSRHDARVYAQRVLGDLQLEIDGQPQRLNLIRVSFPSRSAMRRGEGTIQIDAEVRVLKLGPGRHRLRFRNDHLTRLSVYSANALVPKNREIHITQQQRDPFQREYLLVFEVANAEPERR
jgi:hypothetical protein